MSVRFFFFNDPAPPPPPPPGGGRLGWFGAYWFASYWFGEQAQQVAASDPRWRFLYDGAEPRVGLALIAEVGISPQQLEPVERRVNGEVLVRADGVETVWPAQDRVQSLGGSERRVGRLVANVRRWNGRGA